MTLTLPSSCILKTLEEREYIEVEGPMEDKKKTEDYLYDNRFAIIRTGPKRTSVGAIDSRYFEIHAHRVKEHY